MKSLRQPPAPCANYEKRTNAGAALPSPLQCSSTCCQTEGLWLGGLMSPPQMTALGRGTKFTPHHLAQGDVFCKSRGNRDSSCTNYSGKCPKISKDFTPQDDSPSGLTLLDLSRHVTPARELRQGLDSDPSLPSKPKLHPPHSRGSRALKKAGHRKHWGGRPNNSLPQVENLPRGLQSVSLAAFGLKPAQRTSGKGNFGWKL